MSGPDDTKALVKATAQGVTEGAVRAALEPFVAPFAETGQFVTDLIRFQRWKVQYWILENAKAFLAARGLEPGKIPLKVLVPLLEAASLEDESDEAIHARWAALLANAAAGDAGAPVSPAFPRILSELAPADAAILDRLAASEHGTESLIELQVALHPETRDPVSGSVREHPPFDLHVANLERLALCEVTRQDREVAGLAQEVQRQREELSRLSNHSGFSFGRSATQRLVRGSGFGLPMLWLTEWGTAFVSACSPPSSAKPASTLSSPTNGESSSVIRENVDDTEGGS